MIGKLLCIVCAITIVSSDLSTTACSEDSQCSTGFYCDRGLLACRQCMKCEDLMREDLGSTTDCVRSIAQCGPCLQGLSEDKHGDLNTRCVHQESVKEIPLYVWIPLGVAAILLTISIAVLLWLMKSTHSFKICTSSRTSVHTTTPPLPLDAPPAYTPSPTAPLTSPPIPIPAPVVTRYPPFDDCSEGSQYPLLKPVQAGRREFAGSQVARVFNNPSYLTGIQDADSPESHGSTVGESFTPLHDTTESTWAPEHHSNHNSALSTNTSPIVVASSGQNAIAESPYATGPPAKMVCTRQDTNNNGTSSSQPTQDNTDNALPFTSHFGLPFIINVVKNINTVQQSEVTLDGSLYD